METINRSAFILRPKQPWLDWTKLDDSTGIAEEVFKAMQEEPTVYLLPEYLDDDEQQGVLEDYWVALFEEALSGWLTDPEMWPKKRTYEMFRDWFDVQMMSVVVDLDLEPLEHQE